jgi:replicative DNA helicase
VPAPGNPVADDNGVGIERHVLGTAMESPGEIPGMRVLIEAASFADPRHGEIWTVICDAADGNQPVHPTAITERLIRNGLIGRLPHSAYVFDLYQQAVAAQGAYWARLLAERHTWRTVDVQANRLGNALKTPGMELGQVAALAETVVAAANRVVNPDTGVRHIGELAADYITTYFDYGQDAGIPTPWVDVNRLLPAGGFERGQVVAFGGATGMGKSIAVTDCARHFGVDRQIPTIMFTLEMSAEHVLYRILSALTGIPEHLVKGRELSPDELVRVDNARQRFEASPLWIVEGVKSMTQIINTIRQHQHRYGAIHTVIIDYLQIVKPDGKKENRQLDVSSIVQRMKELALNERLLVLTAAQINRGPGQRPDKRPALSDLRESGEIENSSDVVILIHREDYYDKESPRAGEADFLIEKNRGGVKDCVTLGAQFHLTRFVSMADAWTPSRSVAA